MGLRGEIYYDVRMLFFEEGVDGLSVTDVRFDKAELWIVHDALQRRQIPSVGKLIKTDNPVVRVGIQHVKHKITSDKTGSAGYDDCFR